MDFVSDLITSIQMAGLFLGAFTFSQLSDLIGRKKCFYLAFFLEAFLGTSLIEEICITVHHA